MENTTEPNWVGIREHFMLAPDEVYLNAGTFSALPRSVYDELVNLIAQSEANPTRVAAANSRLPLWASQREMAGYFNADPKDIIFHVNVTQALNQALFGLEWPREGELLVSDQEYGAIVYAALEMARRRGLTVRSFALPLQPKSSEELCNAVEAALSDKTVGVLLSHITSSTGIVVPIEAIAKMLRQRGICFIVDGAHGPGLLPLDLEATQVDIYAGNLHKWFMGPKGTAFLYVTRSLHNTMQPSCVGWGSVLTDNEPIHDEYSGNDYRFQYVFRTQGLRDVSPFLALPATIRFRREIGEENIRRRIEELVAYARTRLTSDAGLQCVSPPGAMNAGLVCFRAPHEWCDAEANERLYQQHRITVAIFEMPDVGVIIRVSPHIWNNFDDIDRLVAALSTSV